MRGRYVCPQLSTGVVAGARAVVSVSQEKAEYKKKVDEEKEEGAEKEEEETCLTWHRCGVGAGGGRDVSISDSAPGEQEAGQLVVGVGGEPHCGLGGGAKVSEEGQILVYQYQPEIWCELIRLYEVFFRFLGEAQTKGVRSRGSVINLFYLFI